MSQSTDIKPRKTEELSGTLERVIFKSPENGFAVVRLKVDARTEVIVRGSFASVNSGEHLTIQGAWVKHPKFGRQFEAVSYSTDLPQSSLGIRKYLGSGMIRGIGKKYAEKLVDRFGAKTLEIIDKHPERLSCVDGIGPKRLESIIAAWKDQKEISKVMVFLQEKGISGVFATKIYKQYGHESIARIQENPYRLADDIWGVGFKSADDVALKLGFAHDSVYRIASAILHLLKEANGNGHLYMQLDQIKERLPITLEYDEAATEWASKIKAAFHGLYEQDKIKLLTKDDDHYIGLPKCYFSEKGIATKILVHQGCTSKLSEKFDLDAVYKQVRVPDERGVDLNEEQQKGILTCLQHNISIITGGPGTGKTTLIKRMLDVLESEKVRFRLAAPTGRAAKRMFEGTGRSSETLHRLLEFSPATMGFLRNEQNALELDVLIVDEASMIDVFLMYSVMRALPQGAHLVLIGDVDQLPSVGAGDVLKDIINSQKVPTIRLQHIFRQAQDSLIIQNAHRVNNGEFPTSFIEGSRNDFKFIKKSAPEEVFSELEKIYRDVLPRQKISYHDAIVLCPMNRGMVGTQRLNQELQTFLNPPHPSKGEISRFSTIYRVGDRVMQIRNNYDKFVYNGDMGIVEDVDTDEQELKIAFGDRVLTYEFSELNEVVLSYAISIHKSQGSEFKAVIIPLFMQHFMMLQRNLIYTAITRAKNLCILMGETRAVAMGVKNNKTTKRITFLVDFLTSDLSARD